MDVSRVLRQLYVGSCPTSVEDINHLKADYRITAVLNLQTEDDFDHCNLEWNSLEARYHELGIAVRWIPLRDFDGPNVQRTLSECVAALDELLRAGHIVYIHCNLGTVRSPTVVVAYLVQGRGWDLEDAIECVTRCCSCSPAIHAIVSAGADRVAA
jgi:protein-tyrosine phosphatase